MRAGAGGSLRGFTVTPPTATPGTAGGRPATGGHTLGATWSRLLLLTYLYTFDIIIDNK